MGERTTVIGTILSVVFQNEENGYTVLRLKNDSGEMVTVVGCFPYAAAGESMIISGNWVNHNVHGRQFKAQFAQRLLPTSANAIYQFLAGGSVKGIGPATASLIVNRFGDNSLDVMLNSWQELTTIKGISAAKAQQISKSFRRQAGVRMLMEFVCSFGLRPVLALRMYRYYGDDALNLLKENPYVIVNDFVGGTFAEADTMALELGIEGNSKNRIGAAALFELVHNTGNGHCFIPREKLAAVLDTITFNPPKFPVLSNVTGQPHSSDPAVIKATMLEQVTGTTNWAADVEAAKALGCTRFVEFGPGKVLSGLIKKIDPVLETANVGDLASLDATVAALG